MDQLTSLDWLTSLRPHSLMPAPAPKDNHAPVAMKIKRFHFSDPTDQPRSQTLKRKPRSKIPSSTSTSSSSPCETENEDRLMKAFGLSTLDSCDTLSTLSDSSSHEKPPLSCICLISAALLQHPEGLTVSQIYQYIQIQFPFYPGKENNAWKSSVRHNLSRSKYFIQIKHESEETTRKSSRWKLHPLHESAISSLLRRFPVLCTPVSPLSLHDMDSLGSYQRCSAPKKIKSKKTRPAASPSHLKDELLSQDSTGSDGESFFSDDLMSFIHDDDLISDSSAIFEDASPILSDTESSLFELDPMSNGFDLEHLRVYDFDDLSFAPLSARPSASDLCVIDGLNVQPQSDLFAFF